MADTGKKKGYFYSSTGSFVLGIVILFVMQFILHMDSWNWGQQKIYFGWVTGEYLYRFFLVSVGAPLAFTLIQKISWPLPK